MPALRHLDLGYSACPSAVLARLRAAAPQLEVAVQPLPTMFRRDEGIRFKIEEEERKQRVWEGREEPDVLDWEWLGEGRMSSASQPAGWGDDSRGDDEDDFE